RQVGEGGRSNSQLRQTFAQGGVSLHDQEAGSRQVLRDPKTPIRFSAGGPASEPRVVVEEDGIRVRPGAVIQVGKRTFVRCVAA
ncbi:MAG: hypothetical protein ACREQ5_41115, partial [Candidatus Dormibacteria bacterium]